MLHCGCCIVTGFHLWVLGIRWFGTPVMYRGRLCTGVRCG